MSQVAAHVLYQMTAPGELCSDAACVKAGLTYALTEFSIHIEGHLQFLIEMTDALFSRKLFFFLLL